MKHSCMAILTAALVTAAFSRDASAAVITLVPSAATVAVGGLVDVNVLISGLDDFDPDQIVAAYDLDVSFGSLFLSPSGVSFGSDLGGPLDSLQDFSFSSGVVDFAEVSFLSDLDLEIMQGDSVLLATLTFQATTAGTAVLAFLSGVDDVKGLGNVPIALTSTGASIVVQGANSPPAIPEPATLVLLGSGLAALALRRRQRAARV